MRFIFRFLWKLFFWGLLVLSLWLYFSPKKDTELTPDIPSIEREILLTPPPRVIFDESVFANHVVVNKSDRRLKLLSNGYWLAEYEIALGSSPIGDKTQQGDGKTPIGEYVLDWRNPNSKFHLSMHISYPNNEQKLRAKSAHLDPGGDIMIHGQPNLSPFKEDAKIKGDWTNGCIAVSNNEMDEIWARVPDGTKITIIE